MKNNVSKTVDPISVNYFLQMKDNFIFFSDEKRKVKKIPNFEKIRTDIKTVNLATLPNLDWIEKMYTEFGISNQKFLKFTSPRQTMNIFLLLTSVIIK